MFIRDVVMDGFKCYAERTAVRNLDRCFTAITGMNGSGKSNIIDAIIFALDLSTSRLMRVSSLKELINTNKKECTVTLVFDNTEKARSPVGYESYETIEVTRSLDTEGKSKYKLNGHSSTKATIENLCKGIGITNDFIVMQGHITKIVNMKSSDLKSMIEETAGTRNYSLEREKSLELLSKKELKLRDAREHLKRTISPFFDQLKKEKKIYEENKDIEANKKIYSKELEDLEGRMACIDLGDKTDELRKMGAQYYKEKRELDEVEAKIRGLGGMRTVNIGEINSQVSAERDKLEDLRAQDPSERIAQRRQEYERDMKVLEEPMVYSLDELREKEAVLSKELLNGMGGDRLGDLERLKDSHGQKLAELSMAQSDAEIKIRSLGISTGDELTSKRVRSLLEECEAREREIRALDGTISVMKSKICYPAVEGVYGTADENFEVVDEKYKEAVLTVLGGRAKFVICRDEEVASRVIQSNDRKISCIPLNKITYSEPSRLPYACVNALDAIRFDRKFERAFKHLFAGFYIFENKAKASECCFECKVMCVTLDGTVYDPRGTLTGGKASFKFDVVRMADIRRHEAELETLRAAQPPQGTLNGLSGLLESLCKMENLSKEVSITKGKIDVLQGVVSSKFDVRHELQRIRNSVVEATKESELRAAAKARSDAAKRELDGLVALERDIKRQIAVSEERLTQLQAQQRTYEIEENTRRMSLRMGDAFDERLKTLIKSTVKLSSRINKLSEELAHLTDRVSVKGNAQVVSDENVRNQPGQTRYDVLLGMFGNDGDECSDFVHFMVTSFDINEDVLLFECSRDPQGRESIGKRIEFLKGKVTQKKVAVSMDPSNFELLEKNAAAAQDLEEKIRKLESDRVEIMKSIERLNEMGVKENRRAFEHINKALRVFLGYFLKNSDICITPEFEIKVKVGTWKNSLTELSGGQRSLIALCLIFSMLTFKPAPFYIFDEVDAALDLNYTQYIGEIIRKEFQGAQFIVVSLKNNMFDNANRIFRVFIQDHKAKVCQIK